MKLGLAGESGKSSAFARQDTSVRDDVASALVNLGYKEAVVTKALGEMEIEAGASMETVLKLALKRLMK